MAVVVSEEFESLVSVKLSEVLKGISQNLHGFLLGLSEGARLIRVLRLVVQRVAFCQDINLFS